MSFQIRVIAPEGVNVTVSREIARMLETVSLEILGGVPPERYQAYQARYQTLRELMTFMDERAQALEKGEAVDDD